MPLNIAKFISQIKISDTVIVQKETVNCIQSFNCLTYHGQAGFLTVNPVSDNLKQLKLRDAWDRDTCYKKNQNNNQWTADTRITLRGEKHATMYEARLRVKSPGGTPYFGLYGEVPLDRVWVFGFTLLNRVYKFTRLCPKQSQNLS